MASTRSQLISIQYARASAALLVVYSHLFGFDFFRAANFSHFGAVGVDLFFVISGFIMWQTSVPLSPVDFARKRAVRIIPAYWFFTILLVGVFVVAPTLAPRVNFTATEFFKSLFFIPYRDASGNNNPILQQGWTLNYEAYFYLIVGLCLFVKSPNLRFVLAATVLTVGAVAGVVYKPETAVLAMLCSTTLLEFLFGMLISKFWSATDMSIGKGLIFLILGVCGLVASDAIGSQPEWRGLVCGIPAALTLIGLIGLEPIFRKKPNRALLLIGELSYALYLCHPFALSAIKKLFSLVQFRFIAFENETILAVSFGLVGMLAALGLSWISYVSVERHGATLLNFILSKRTGAEARNLTNTLGAVSDDRLGAHVARTDANSHE